MKRILILLLLFIQFESLYGQTQESGLEVVLKNAIQAGDIQPDSGIVILENLVESAKTIGDTAVSVDANFHLGRLYSATANFPKSILCLQEALQGYRNLKDTLGEGRSLIELGVNYAYLRINDKALDYYLAASDLFKKRSDSLSQKNTATTYLNLGNIYHDIFDTISAEKYLLKGLQLAQKLGDQRLIAGGYMNLAILHLRTGGDSLLSYSKKAIDLCLDQKNYEWVAFLQSEVGHYFQKKKNYQRALSEFRKGADYASRSPRWLTHNQIMLRLGKVFLEMEQPDSALYFGKKALAVGEEQGNVLHQKDSYEIIAEANNALGNYKDAFRAEKQFSILKDTVWKQNQLLEIGRVEGLHELALLENQISFQKAEVELLAKKEAKAREVTKLWFFVSGLLLLILTGLVVFFYFYRKKSRELLIKERLLAESVQQNLELKTQELINMASAIGYKNEIILKSENVIKKVTKLRNIENIQLKLKNFSSELKQLKNTDTELDFLFSSGDEIFREFVVQLSNEFSQLTQRDLKLCALVRLGLSTKEIASIFGISAKAAEMGKYRLKKKFDLGPDEDLYEFIRTI